MTDNEKLDGSVNENVKSTDTVVNDDNADKDDGFFAEGSTIFTRSPSVSKESEDKKAQSGESKKKTVLTVISAALVVALGLGIFFVVKFVPNAADGSSSTVSSSTVPMSDIDKSKVLSVSKEGHESSFTVLRGDEVDNSGSSSDDGVSYDWYLEGIDQKYTSSILSEGYVNSVVSLKAMKEFPFDERTDYGFSSPYLTVTVAISDGTEKKLLVGNKMELYNGYYSMFEGSDKCYVISSSAMSDLDMSDTDFSNNTLLSPIDSSLYGDYFNGTTLMYFDYINISGTAYSNPVRIICDKSNPSNNYYHMTRPQSRVADAEALDNILKLFTDGVTASGVFSYKSDSAVLKEYGLDAPKAVLTAKLGDVLIKISVGKEVDGYYAFTYNDNEPIYKIGAENDSVFFADVTPEYFVSSLSISDNITLIESFRFTTDGFDKTIKLTHDKDDPSNWTADCGGVEMDTDSVKYLYQHIMRAVPLVTLFDAHEGKAEYTVTISFTDGSTPKVLKFVPDVGSSRRYIAWINDMPIGSVAADLVNNIDDAAKTVCSGGTIVSPVY